MPRPSAGGSYVHTSSRAHTQKHAYAAETSMHGKRFPYFASSAANLHHTLEWLNTLCGGSPFADALSGIGKSVLRQENSEQI